MIQRHLGQQPRSLITRIHTSKDIQKGFLQAEQMISGHEW